MPDPLEDTLAELGLDSPDPTHLAALWGTLFAEPDALAEWAHTSGHPRLAAAYLALQQRVGARTQDVRARVADELGHRLVARATEAAASEARDIEFELSRLKWLHANRATRIAAADALGPHYERHADVDESDGLRELLHAAGRGLC